MEHHLLGSVEIANAHVVETFEAVVNTDSTMTLVG